MAGDWREDFRHELDNTQIDDYSVDDSSVAAYLRSAGKALGSSPGIGEMTLRFLLETEPSANSSVAFEKRLVETMRLAAQVREFSLEARTLLKGRVAFGHALRQMIEERGNRIPLNTRELEKLETAQKPQSIGAKALGDIVKLSNLSFLRVFCLTACALEEDFTAARSSLASEGIARTDRAISKTDRQKQSVDVASAVLRPKREESLAFLAELASITTGEATL